VNGHSQDGGRVSNVPNADYRGGEV